MFTRIPITRSPATSARSVRSVAEVVDTTMRPIRAHAATTGTAQNTQYVTSKRLSPVNGAARSRLGKRNSVRDLSTAILASESLMYDGMPSYT